MKDRISQGSTFVFPNGSLILEAPTLDREAIRQAIAAPLTPEEIAQRGQSPVEDETIENTFGPRTIEEARARVSSLQIPGLKVITSMRKSSHLERSSTKG